MLKKIKEFFSKFWGYFVAGFGAIAGIIFLKKQTDNYETIVQKLQESHEKELDEIKKAREEERKAYEANEKKYQERMALVEKEYEAAKKNLDEKKRKEIEDIVRNYSNQPDELAKKLAEVTGFVIIMPEDSYE